MEKGPLVRHAIWYGDWDWTIVSRERIGGKELAVVSVQFSVPRDPPRDFVPPSRVVNTHPPRKVTKREFESAAE